MHEAPNDGMVSTGICTRCQRDLVQSGDTLGCPECGEKVSISTLHARLRLKIDRTRPTPKENLNVGVGGPTAHVPNSPGMGTTASATGTSGPALGRTKEAWSPITKKSPIGSFTELLNELRRIERK